MASPGVTNKKRLLTMLVGVTFIFFALIIRVGWIQLYRGAWLQNKAIDQWTRDLPVAPKRGLIQDRNGKVLAQSASSETVILRPSQIKSPQEVADKLAPILDMDRSKILEKASDKKKSEIWLKRQITKEQANQIRALKSRGELKGVLFTEESKRYYPMKNFLAQVLGFTSIDGVGLEGIEAKYDKYLRGTPGKIVSETDSVGRELPYNVERYVPPKNGLNVSLTIDYIIQSFVEKALDDALVSTKSKRVEAIVMDPKTGEVLALANKEDYDPNNPPRDNMDELRRLSRNSIVSDVYEPGSTFKIITSAAGLEAGVVKPTDTFYDPGYKMVDGERIKCWRSYNPHGHETFVEGVQNSCNPVFMEVAERLGKERFYDYIKAFGFGDYSGIDISGDEMGLVRPIKYVKNVDLARISFGQTIAVTPLQLITAVSAVINGGNLMTPHLVKSLVDEEGKVVKEVQPTLVRKVISEQTSKTMRDILESVVSDGSGSNAYIPGYKIGGKTGTAQKYENGKILTNKHIASFVGFAPADDPKVAILVILDEPNVPVDFGGVIAAPVVKSILEDTLKYMNIQPMYQDKEQKEAHVEVVVPDITNMELSEAVKELNKAGLQFLVEGSGGKIKDQMPKPGAKVMKKSIMLLYVDHKEGQEETSDEIEVPDVAGKSMIEVNTIISSYGLKLEIKGNGVAISQSLEPGTKVKPGTTITVEFQAPTSE